MRLVSPLEGLESLLIGKQIHVSTLIGMGIPVLLTVFLGRVFCSWVCPIIFLAEMLADVRSLIRKNAVLRDRLVLARRLLWFALIGEVLLSLILGAPLFVFLSPPGLVGRELMMAVFFQSLAWEGVLVVAVLALELLTADSTAVIFVLWAAAGAFGHAPENGGSANGCQLQPLRPLRSELSPWPCGQPGRIALRLLLELRHLHRQLRICGSWLHLAGGTQRQRLRLLFSAIFPPSSRVIAWAFRPLILPEQGCSVRTTRFSIPCTSLLHDASARRFCRRLPLGFLSGIDYFALHCRQANKGDTVNQDLPERSHGVQRFLDENRTNSQVCMMAGSARTAQEAADALGCTVAEIAKSVVFRGKMSNRPVLVIACGDNRINEKKVAALIGEKIGRADAEFVRTRTGFAIGGVAPFAHKEPPLVVVDAMVQRFPRMWAAGGTPETMFAIATTDLIRLAGGPLADIAG